MAIISFLETMLLIYLSYKVSAHRPPRPPSPRRPPILPSDPRPPLTSGPAP